MIILGLSKWNCPVDLPLIAGSASKTCQCHLEQGFANYGSRPQMGSRTNWLDKSDINVSVNLCDVYKYH